MKARTQPCNEIQTLRCVVELMVRPQPSILVGVICVAAWGVNTKRRTSSETALRYSELECDSKAFFHTRLLAGTASHHIVDQRRDRKASSGFHKIASIGLAAVKRGFAVFPAS